MDIGIFNSAIHNEQFSAICQKNRLKRVLLDKVHDTKMMMNAVRNSIYYLLYLS